MNCAINSHISYMDNFFENWLESAARYDRSAIAEGPARLLIPLQFQPFHEDIITEVRRIQGSPKVKSIDYFTDKKIRALIKKHIPRPEIPSPPEGQYNVIVIDPPWPLGGVNYEYRDRSSTITRAIERPYYRMTIEEISNMDIPAADDCILWLWTTNINLHNAFHVLEEWGFIYRSCLTWAKPTMGLGYWLRGQTEHCLLATKGKPVWTNTHERTLLKADRGEDSRKPDAFYSLVDRICKGTKIDMFSREKREGWEQWGDEVDKF